VNTGNENDPLHDWEFFNDRVVCSVSNKQDIDDGNGGLSCRLDICSIPAAML
jgi:hypothetical protein